MKQNRLFVVIIIAGILLFAVLAKPDKEHFELWIKNKYNEERAENEKNILEKGVKELGKFQASSDVTYKNRLIYATAETEAFGEEAKYVGLFGTWIKTSDKE